MIELLLLLGWASLLILFAKYVDRFFLFNLFRASLFDASSLIKSNDDPCTLLELLVGLLNETIKVFWGPQRHLIGFRHLGERVVLPRQLSHYHNSLRVIVVSQRSESIPNLHLERLEVLWYICNALGDPIIGYLDPIALLPNNLLFR